ncbi:MAG TPA: hypothetical protein VHB72_00665 [Candidatus Saccharimonadales bacterium]|nr:hypothetical protein [Candidatus Saccharimonadales bacterium]
MNSNPNSLRRTTRRKNLATPQWDKVVSRFSDRAGDPAPSHAPQPANGRDAWGDPGPTHREVKAQKAKERDSIWGIAGATATAAAIGLVAFALTKGDGGKPKDTTPYPGDARVSYTIPEGGGALDAVRAVDPRIADNAWTSPEAQQRLNNLEHFIDGQAPAGQNGVLQEGQTVHVPVIPGAQYPNNHSQNQS